MKKINVKTVGTTKIDKQIYKLYKGFNFSENYDFWNKYILLLKVQFTNNGNLFEKNWEFLDIYSKMILNIIYLKLKDIIKKYVHLICLL